MPVEYTQPVGRGFFLRMPRDVKDKRWLEQRAHQPLVGLGSVNDVAVWNRHFLQIVASGHGLKHATTTKSGPSCPPMNADCRDLSPISHLGAKRCRRTTQHHAKNRATRRTYGSNAACHQVVCNNYSVKPPSAQTTAQGLPHTTSLQSRRWSA
jgi:hypothetical protein